MSRMIPRGGKLWTKVSHSNIKYGVLAFGCLGAVIGKGIPGSRDILPEPFDVFDHAGNINISAQAGYVAGLATGIYCSSVANNEDGTSVGKIRSKMALAGVATGLALNALVETKFGIRLTHYENTPDLIDLAYGVGSAAIAASLVPNVEQDR